MRHHPPICVISLETITPETGLLVLVHTQHTIEEPVETQTPFREGGVESHREPNSATVRKRFNIKIKSNYYYIDKIAWDRDGHYPRSAEDNNTALFFVSHFVMCPCTRNKETCEILELSQLTLEQLAVLQNENGLLDNEELNAIDPQSQLEALPWVEYRWGWQRGSAMREPQIEPIPVPINAEAFISHLTADEPSYHQFHNDPIPVQRFERQHSVSHRNGDRIFFGIRPRYCLQLNPEQVADILRLQLRSIRIVGGSLTNCDFGALSKAIWFGDTLALSKKRWEPDDSYGYPTIDKATLFSLYRNGRRDFRGLTLSGKLSHGDELLNCNFRYCGISVEQTFGANFQGSLFSKNFFRNRIVRGMLVDLGFLSHHADHRYEYYKIKISFSNLLSTCRQLLEENYLLRSSPIERFFKNPWRHYQPVVESVLASWEERHFHAVTQVAQDFGVLRGIHINSLLFKILWCCACFNGEGDISNILLQRNTHHSPTTQQAVSP